MEIYKWKRMVLGALGFKNNADFEGNNSKRKIVLDMFIIRQKYRQVSCHDVIPNLVYIKQILYVVSI